MTEQFVNYSPLAPIELSANVSSGATALALTGAGIGSLPSSGTYRFLIDGEEIVKVTAYSGSTATVVRGTEGTSAVAHNAGASVIPILTKAAMAQFATDVGGLTQVVSANVGAPAGGATGLLPFNVASSDGTWIWNVTATMRVTATTGLSEAVGDTYVSNSILVWKSVSSVVSIVPNVEEVSPVASDASMDGDSTAGFTQDVAGVDYQLPNTLDPSTTVGVSITAQLLGVF